MSSTLTLENVLYEKKGAIAYVTRKPPQGAECSQSKDVGELARGF